MFRPTIATPIATRLRISFAPLLSDSASVLSPLWCAQGSRRVSRSNDKADKAGYELILSNARESFESPESRRASRLKAEREAAVESQRSLNLRKKLEMTSLPYFARGGMSLVSWGPGGRGRGGPGWAGTLQCMHSRASAWLLFFSSMPYAGLVASVDR